MSEQVKRHYNAPKRAERAAATRRAIVSAARDLLVDHGYTAMTVAKIASQAGVAVDTVYATVGRKPDLLRELVETALSGTDEAVTAQQRDYVKAIKAAPAADEKLALYAEAVTAIQARLAPVFLALQQAAPAEPECALLWHDISARRAANMREFAADLRVTGRLRPDLTDAEVADIIWSMNAAEYYLLLVAQRGWTPRRFQDWLTDAWTRTLLITD